MNKTFFKSILFLMSISILIACNNPSEESSRPLDPNKERLKAAAARNCEAGSYGPTSNIIGGQKLSSYSQLSRSVVVLVSAMLDSEDYELCTATLISKDVLLTASHCVDRINKNKSYVALSTDLLCDLGQNNSQKFLEISMTIMHPNYKMNKDLSKENKEDLTYDVALVKLKNPVPAGYLPMQIGYSESNTSNQIVSLGFGVTSPTGKDDVDPMLNWVYSKPYPVNEDNFNNSEIAKVSFLTTSTINNFWFIDNSVGNGICMGDSGGPLLVKTKYGFRIIGVASFVIKSKTNQICGGIGTYTKVAPHQSMLRAMYNALDSKFNNPF